MGLPYQLADVGDQTIISNGKQWITIPMQIDEVSRRWYKWQMNGELIQNAFPELTPDQREFIMTGITPAEWGEIFKDEQ